MVSRPRVAKGSSGPLRKDGSVSPDSKPPECKSQREDEVMADDGQDSDEEMEDGSTEGSEDEGSLYTPSEATSELGEEEPDEHEDLVELPQKDLCKFLVLLPRELRDKIYGLVLQLDTPISDHKFRFKCVSCRSLTSTTKIPAWHSQICEARNLLRTCHQIRKEGKQVFYEVNSWSLYRARLRDTPPVHSSTVIDETKRMFDRIRQTKATKHFHHVNMHILLSPLAYCDFTIPESVALDDPIALRLFEMSQDPAVLAHHKLDETAQCGLFRAALGGFVENQAKIFPALRSFTLEVSLHGNRLVPGFAKDPLNRCGITFYVTIKLESKNRAPLRYHYNASLPGRATGSVEYDAFSSSRADYEAYKALQLDPRRRMLRPLEDLFGVQSVEVERRWTVCFRRRPTEDGTVMIHAQPLRQLWRFRTVLEMLEGAGAGFAVFLDPALEVLKISRKDVVEIIENTTEDPGHHLILQADHPRRTSC